MYFLSVKYLHTEGKKKKLLPGNKSESQSMICFLVFFVCKNLILSTKKRTSEGEQLRINDSLN